MPDDRRTPPPMHTPIPYSADRKIDLKAIELADCRTDLTDAQRHSLARILAMRCRIYRKDWPLKP